MKKSILVLAILLIVAGVVSAQQLPLKEVIQNSARGLEETIPQGTAIAILNFKSPKLKFSEYVIETLIDELLETGKLAIVDRSNLDIIRTEQRLTLSGDVSDSSAIAIGKMLGARYIITGSITDMQTYYQFRLRIVNVETSTIQRQLTFELQHDEQVAKLLGIQKATVANVRDNWASVDLSFNGDWSYGYGANISARYERMLNANMSLGANVNISFRGEIRHNNDLDPSIKLPPGNSFAIDAVFCYYPWGGAFFWSLGLGFYSGAVWAEYEVETKSDTSSYDMVTTSLLTGHFSGLEIPVEIGWKIDIGADGGLFVQTGILGAFVFGKDTYVGFYGKDFDASRGEYDYGESYADLKKEYAKGSPDDARVRIFPQRYSVYFGVGWAF